ncbi:MAG: hypothetical protein WCF36_13565 [Candidatus Nanopelagicales bacterium]
MFSSERVIESTDAGDIYMTAVATTRRFYVTDSSGNYVTGPGPVDMATAFRVLDAVLKSTGSSTASAPSTLLAAS